MSQIIIRYEIITSDNLRYYINSIHNNDNSYKQLLVNFKDLYFSYTKDKVNIKPYVIIGK